MSVLEILFITSCIALLVPWIAFIVLGFGASTLWGLGQIFLFPISPFMFYHRFERKARKIILPFLFTLGLFILLQGVIFFFTLDFYPGLATKLEKLLPQTEEKPVEAPVQTPNDVKTPVQQTPTGTPSDTTPTDSTTINQTSPADTNNTITPVSEESNNTDPNSEQTETPIETTTVSHGYTDINFGDAGRYLNKNIIVTTISAASYKGRLISADANKLEVKIHLGGGSSTMNIKKSAIKKIQVYL